ncbi:hypothetical protein OIU77_024330 [Salix suchowensis]|uniref:HotDog ACOT-type domain-containing protein n=1 Tax=Salix suchowensis TaxID=1278906 RepID=A0ABQ9BUX3_9ROSI|nr:hypothetical protein OIU77_024330 [Salix suchowensis]
MEFNSSSPRAIRVVSTFANPFDDDDNNNNSLTGVDGQARKAHSFMAGDVPFTGNHCSVGNKSRTSILYSFSSDYILREQYRDPWNEVRVGKLLEDLDALAGTISVKHCSDDDNTTRPLLLVTAAVDKIVLKKPISVDIDLKIVGSVIWVGRSSIDILLEVLQSTKETSDTFRLAEASSKLRKKKKVEEKKEFENGEPQQRNIHGRIFGGFLMHRAFELAFSTAYAFAGMVPYFLEVDHVDFLRPVDVGDFLRIKSCVLYTEHENSDKPLINIEVVAHVTRPELRSSEVSNTFYFTFTVPREAKAMNNGFRIRKVVPATEEEARCVLKRMDAESLQSNKGKSK